MATLRTVCPILVGRDREVRALRDALETGGLVLVFGEAGIGKSRLVREFAESIRQPVVWGRAESVTRAGPYSTILDLCEDAAVLLETAAADARELAALLMTLTAGTEPPARQVSARIRGFLARAGRGVVVVLEDLHFADELSLAVVAHLARSAADDGTLIVGTLRPSEAAHGPVARLLDVVTRDRIATTIELEPLDHDDIEAMVEAMWERAPSVEELAALEKLGEGVPFFIEELAAARAAGHRDVPGTIARAVGARLDRLDDRARGVIVAASLMSGALDPAVLAIVSGIAEREIPAHLIAAARAGLLADDEGHLVFRHALVRESIASSILSVERQELHEKLARALEQRYAQDLDAHAAALARHWSEAGDATRAAEWWVKAGERALDAGALDEARDAFALVSASAEEPVQLRAAMGQGHIAARTRAYDEAKATFRTVADRHRANAEFAEAARALLSLAKLYLNDFDRTGLVVLDEAHALLDPDHPVAVRVLVEKGFALVRTFDEASAAEAPLEEGYKHASALAEPDSLALALQGLAWIAETEGDVGRANDLLRTAIDLTDRLRDLDMVTSIASQHALFEAQQGSCATAIEIVQPWRDRFAERLMGARVSTFDHILAWLHWRRGMPASAEQIALRLESTRWAMLWGRVVRVWSAVERGADELGRAILDAWWAEMGDPAHRLHAMLNPEEAGLSEGYAALTELVFAAFSPRAVTDEALASARAHAAVRVPAPDVHALAQTLSARTMIRAGDGEGARQVIDELNGFMSSRRYPWHLGAMDEIRGELAADQDAARRSFELAASHFASGDNLGDQARCLRMLASTVDGDVRIAHLKRARELAQAAGASAEGNRIEALLREAGVRPRAGRPKGSRRVKDGLSAREQEVAVLVAGGATNAEIAARLFLSERTVEDHISKATRRLGVGGRAGLAAWAAKQGLI